MFRKWRYWEVTLREPEGKEFMTVQVQKCSKEEALELAQAQNERFAFVYARPEYKLESIKKMK